MEPLLEPNSGEECEKVVGAQPWRLPPIHSGEKEMRLMGSGGLEGVRR